MQLSPQSSAMTSFLMVNFTVKFEREHRERVGKIGNFHPISRRISQTVQDKTKVTAK